MIIFIPSAEKEGDKVFHDTEENEKVEADINKEQRTMDKVDDENVREVLTEPSQQENENTGKNEEIKENKSKIHYGTKKTEDRERKSERGRYDPLKDKGYPFYTELLRKTFNLPNSKRVNHMIRELKRGRVTVRYAANRMGVDKDALHDFLTHQKHTEHETTLSKATSKDTPIAAPIRRSQRQSLRGSKYSSLNCSNISRTPRSLSILKHRKWEFDETRLQDISNIFGDEFDWMCYKLKMGSVSIESAAQVLGVCKRALYEFLMDEMEKKGQEQHHPFISSPRENPISSVNNVRNELSESMPRTGYRFQCKLKQGAVDFLRCHYGISNNENEWILQAMTKGRISVRKIAGLYGKYGMDEEALMQFIVVLCDKQRVRMFHGSNVDDVSLEKIHKIGFTDNAREKDWILRTLQEGTISVVEAAELYGVDKDALEKLIDVTPGKQEMIQNNCVSDEIIKNIHEETNDHRRDKYGMGNGIIQAELLSGEVDTSRFDNINENENSFHERSRENDTVPMALQSGIKAISKTGEIKENEKKGQYRTENELILMALQDGVLLIMRAAVMSGINKDVLRNILDSVPSKRMPFHGAATGFLQAKESILNVLQEGIHSVMMAAIVFGVNKNSFKQFLEHLPDKQGRHETKEIREYREVDNESVECHDDLTDDIRIRNQLDSKKHDGHDFVDFVDKLNSGYCETMVIKEAQSSETRKHTQVTREGVIRNMKDISRETADKFEESCRQNESRMKTLQEGISSILKAAVLCGADKEYLRQLVDHINPNVEENNQLESIIHRNNGIGSEFSRDILHCEDNDNQLENGESEMQSESEICGSDKLSDQLSTNAVNGYADDEPCFTHVAYKLSNHSNRGCQQTFTQTESMKEVQLAMKVKGSLSEYEVEAGQDGRNCQNKVSSANRSDFIKTLVSTEEKQVNQEGISQLSLQEAAREVETPNPESSGKVDSIKSVEPEMAEAIKPVKINISRGCITVDAKNLQLPGMAEAANMVRTGKLSVKAAACKFNIPIRKLENFISTKRRGKYKPKPKMEKSLDMIIMEQASIAVKKGKINVKDASIKFLVPQVDLEDFISGKSDIADRLKIIPGVKPVPRRFIPGGKESLLAMKIDRSKDWVLQSLEDGNISVREASLVFGVPIHMISKRIYSINEDEMRQGWKKEDLEKAATAVSTSNISFKAAAAAFNVPKRALKSHIRGEMVKLKLDKPLTRLKIKHEQKLKEWLLALHKKNQKVSTRDIFSFVKAILANSHQSYPQWEGLTYPDQLFTKIFSNFLNHHKDLTAIVKTLRKRGPYRKRKSRASRVSGKSHIQRDKSTEVYAAFQKMDKKRRIKVGIDSAADATRERSWREDIKEYQINEETERLSCSEYESDEEQIQAINSLCMDELLYDRSPSSADESIDSHQSNDSQHLLDKDSDRLNSGEDSDEETKSSADENVEEEEHTSKEGYCAKCGESYDPESPCSDVWIQCGSSNDDGNLIDGCSSWFHITCTELKDCEISAKELALLTWHCEICTNASLESNLG